MNNESDTVQELFRLLRAHCRSKAIRAVGKGWDANYRESEFWRLYWRFWCETCSALGVSETWWIRQ